MLYSNEGISVGPTLIKILQPLYYTLFKKQFYCDLFGCIAIIIISNKYK